MSVVGLVPARGGSKGIPRKNLAPLGGRPLLAWTVEAALGCRALSRVIVSTDDAEIAGVARAHGAEVPFMRPTDLASDEAGALGVIRHAIEALEASGDTIDAVVYLQPTSPLRTSRHIDAALDLYRARNADSVVSVCAVPHNMAIESQLTLHGDARLVAAAPGAADPLRRQAKVRRYARNGPALIVTARRCIMERGVLYGERTFGLEMSALDSMDVDEPADLQLIEAWLQWRQRQ